MKTSFKTRRGRVYHVIHETKTDADPKTCWTICGQSLDDSKGDRSNRAPTCPNCMELDNPFSLTMERQILAIAWKTSPAALSVSSRLGQRLLLIDLINIDGVLTRRGKILAADFHEGAVPLPDATGVMHARHELTGWSRCSAAAQLDGYASMTIHRYEQLRKVEHLTVVTCLACLGT